LIEAGFEYIIEFEGKKLFRKRNEMTRVYTTVENNQQLFSYGLSGDISRAPFPFFLFEKLQGVFN